MNWFPIPIVVIVLFFPPFLIPSSHTQLMMMMMIRYMGSLDIHYLKYVVWIRRSRRRRRREYVNNVFVESRDTERETTTNVSCCVTLRFFFVYKELFFNFNYYRGRVECFWCLFLLFFDFRLNWEFLFDFFFNEILLISPLKSLFIPFSIVITTVLSCVCVVCVNDSLICECLYEYLLHEQILHRNPSKCWYRRAE